MCENLDNCTKSLPVENKENSNEEKIKYIIEKNNNTQKQDIINEIQNCIKDAIPEQISGPYSIDKFVDGDTLWIRDGCGKREKLRLLGIDTPETVHPRIPVECYGPEASQKIKELLQSKKLYLEIDSNKGRGKYGRLLVYIYSETEFRKSINIQLIEGGYAEEYTYKEELYREQENFKIAQKKAENEDLGIWGEKCKDSMQ